MATFESADAAAAAAVRMQEDVTGTLFAEGPRVKIRVGFRFGPVLRRRRPTFSARPWTVAARMASLGQGRADRHHGCQRRADVAIVASADPPHRSEGRERQG
ncbi:MAG: hypothetical protein MZW92_35795 [Comamonadaceae bacterium]|nr:hypothetical protein [Comamonadaceae bacterium]